jgi:hypothetical protein
VSTVLLQYLKEFVNTKFRILYEWVGQILSGGRGRKSKFNILNQSPDQRSSIRNVNRQNAGKFKSATTTRPQVCPLCRTPETLQSRNISRRSDGMWECKACKHHWRS